MTKPHLLVHHTEDSVGVVVVEDLKANTQMNCANLDNNTQFNLENNSDVPIGHKVALKDMSVGDTVIKYGHDIGEVKAAITKGDHVHVHNIKTKRW